MGLVTIVSAVLRRSAAKGLVVFVSANDSVEIIVMMHCRPFGVLSESPLLLEVPQHNVPLFDVPGIGLWIRGVHVMSGGPVLRGVPKQLLPEPDETLPPALGIIQVLRDSELLSLVGPLLPSSSPPAHQDNHEDEGASESHEEDLPPLEPVGVTFGGSRRVDTGNTGQRWGGPCPGGLGNHHELG